MRVLTDIYLDLYVLLNEFDSLHVLHLTTSLFLTLYYKPLSERLSWDDFVS